MAERQKYTSDQRAGAGHFFSGDVRLPRFTFKGGWSVVRVLKHVRVAQAP